ncbi:MAG: DNA polymerase III subunit alpha [Candidatus Pacebacteria bacterium]|nr:DNA polymerase III subunit alpha [Candidatus Paceibacterota bacterium]
MARANTPFSHLHVHSHYSLLQALPQIDDLVAAAKKDGQQALALTDAGALYGAIDFYKACKKAGIKPIIGVDAYIAPRKRDQKEHNIDDRTSRLVLLVKNETGYKNLVQLVTTSFLEGFYYNPRADRDLLLQHREGLIAILPSFAGEPAQHLKNHDEARADEALSWYRDTFGDDLYMEITKHGEILGHDERMLQLIALAKKRAVPLVAAHDTYYLKQEDSFARELVYKIKTGGAIDRELADKPDDFSFISQKRARELFTDLPEALDNVQKIVDACNLELVLGKAIFPKYPVPEGAHDDDVLRVMAEAGLKARGMENPEAQKRLDYELGIIAKKGYSSYFLVVADLLQYASAQGIFTNTRGSAAGSLVSYCCGITTVDPIAFRMPFERFLNPERPSAPDIDMDIADNRRDELIDYARRKYGEEHVAQLGTFGTMLARAAVRDVARALGHSYNTGDMIAKIIPPPKQGFPVTIEGALKDVPELKEIYNNDPDAREILDLAQKIEGNARHVGVHAAGVIIAPMPVSHIAPIQFDPKGGKTITQYDMYSIVDEYGGVGLLKFDFLGLKNLSVLADSVLRVKGRLQQSVDIVNVELTDTKTYEMLARGETLGVFQMASEGMTKHLVDLKPSTIHDLNAMVALYRPGPMAFIPEYIARKNNPSQVRYLDPRMESILKPTYGILIYQDDVMTMAVELAGYSWGEADKFRKAMGKKIPEEMAAQKERFLTGCIERNMKPAIAKELWEQIETFAAYGFNKAHAASYGNLAYKTAYMKANFPVDYMAALLTADSGDVEKIGEIVAECRHMKIAVLPPDVNESFADFTVVNESTIRFGLKSIKNFGEGISNTIIAERTQGGRFASLGDFLARIKDKNLNKKSLEALIMTGALDHFGERNAMLTNIEKLLEYHKEHMRAPENQVSLFGAVETAAQEFVLPSAAPATQDVRLAWEKDLLGLYVSGHPLDKFKEKLSQQKMNIAQMKEKLAADTQTVMAGMIETKQEILTKNGDKMAFIKLADFSGAIETVLFPRVFKEFSASVVEGTCVAIKGRMSPRNGEQTFVAEIVKKL